MIGNWYELGRYFTKSSKQFFTEIRLQAKTITGIIGPLKSWFRLLSAFNRFASTVSLSTGWSSVFVALLSLLSMTPGTSKLSIGWFDWSDFALFTMDELKKNHCYHCASFYYQIESTLTVPASFWSFSRAILMSFFTSWSCITFSSCIFVSRRFNWRSNCSRWRRTSDDPNDVCLVSLPESVCRINK